MSKDVTSSGVRECRPQEGDKGLRLWELRVVALRDVGA